ncbi:glutaredoxin family protein [Parahaliea aestuarii]|uniref:Glutaredoxin family protein n=1 Tax=Parahaliea aestuarii TaxID=1852021 RepID=A0A5C8ZZX9_9GAMM|nr:glutaredoxin family protein [Parahaliea aestuarii]TXS93182.1 glutaredoxin family protein [Parahaliea aestuarii]
MHSNQRELELLGTGGCHLCEQAEEILKTLQRAGCPFRYRVVDIACDDALFERYGLLIPVLRGAAGEARWPFVEEEVLALTGEPAA